jgi:autotransporter-associated beta strand protein
MIAAICRIALGIVAGTAGTLTLQAATIVEWTFEGATTPTAATNVAVYPTAIGPTTGTGTAGGVHASAGTDWSAPVGNGSGASFSSNEWAIGDYYQFQLSTTGFDTIQLTWDQTRSGTGPGTFDLAYSTDGTNFSIFAPADNYTVTQINWSGTTANPASTFTFDLSSIIAINNQANVFFRLIADAAPGATGGTNRVDNFKVAGSVIVPPAVDRYWDPNGGPGVGGSGIWNPTNTNWNTAADGTGSAVSITPSDRAIFSGSPGSPFIVTIEAPGVTANGGLVFERDGYTIAGPGILTLGAGAVTVNHVSGATTISAVIQGTAGLTKAGAGVLTLTGTNTFSGNVHINEGTLRIDRPENLGDSGNDLIFDGGTLNPTASMSLGAQQNLTGPGKLDIPAGTTLTVQGDITMSSLELLSSGTFAPVGAVKDIVALTFQSAATVANTGALNLASIKTNQATGTATVNGPVVFTANGLRTVDVSDSSAAVDLALLGDVTLGGTGGNSKLYKIGPGTLDLLGANNSALAGVRLGTAGSPMDAGGLLIIHNKDSLGSNEFQFNNGILQVATPLTGTNGIPLTVRVSVGGGSGSGDTSSAVITGSPVEFGGDLILFNNFSSSYLNVLTVDTAVTFDGLFMASQAASAGLTVKGSGSLSFPNLSGGSHAVSESISIEGPSVSINGALSAIAGVTVKSGRFSGNAGIAGFLTVGDSVGVDDAILSPGDGIGTMSAASLSLDSDAVLKLEINSSLIPPAADKLTIAGAVILGSGIAKLDVSDLGSAILSEPLSLVIIDNTSGLPLSPTDAFEGLPDGSPLLIGANLFRIEYDFGPDSNDVALVLIPEPAAIGGLLVGVGLLGLRRRRPATR